MLLELEMWLHQYWQSHVPKPEVSVIVFVRFYEYSDQTADHMGCSEMKSSGISGDGVLELLA